MTMRTGWLKRALDRADKEVRSRPKWMQPASIRANALTRADANSPLEEGSSVREIEQPRTRTRRAR